MAITKEINPADIQPDITNDLIKGIVGRLYATFGDSYTFYTEDVPQGFKTPCFAVISMNDIPARGGLENRKYWRFPFDVHYFCDSAKPRQEWNTVKQKMSLALEWIEACNTKLQAEIQPSNFDSEQGVGHFYIVYGMHLFDVYSEQPKMKTLETTDGKQISGKCETVSD